MMASPDRADYLSVKVHFVLFLCLSLMASPSLSITSASGGAQAIDAVSQQHQINNGPSAEIYKQSHLDFEDAKESSSAAPQVRASMTETESTMQDQDSQEDKVEKSRTRQVPSPWQNRLFHWMHDPNYRNATQPPPPKQFVRELLGWKAALKRGRLTNGTVTKVGEGRRTPYFKKTENSRVPKKDLQFLVDPRVSEEKANRESNLYAQFRGSKVTIAETNSTYGLPALRQHSVSQELSAPSSDPSAALPERRRHNNLQSKGATPDHLEAERQSLQTSRQVHPKHHSSLEEHWVGQEAYDVTQLRLGQNLGRRQQIDQAGYYQRTNQSQSTSGTGANAVRSASLTSGLGMPVSEMRNNLQSVGQVGAGKTDSHYTREVSCQRTEQEYQILRKSYQKNLESLKLVLIEVLDRFMTNPEHLLSGALCDVLNLPNRNSRLASLGHKRKDRSDSSVIHDDVNKDVTIRDGGPAWSFGRKRFHGKVDGDVTSNASTAQSARNGHRDLGNPRKAGPQTGTSHFDESWTRSREHRRNANRTRHDNLSVSGEQHIIAGNRSSRVQSHARLDIAEGKIQDKFHASSRSRHTSFQNSSRPQNSEERTKVVADTGPSKNRSSRLKPHAETVDQTVLQGSDGGSEVFESGETQKGQADSKRNLSKKDDREVEVQKWRRQRVTEDTTGNNPDIEKTEGVGKNCTLGSWTDWSSPVGFGVIERRRLVVEGEPDCKASENDLVMRVDISVYTANNTYYKTAQQVGQDFESDFTNLHEPRDLLLVLDASGSIEEADFHLMKEGVAVLVDLLCGGFGGGPKNNRLAIIVFASDITIVHKFNDDQTPSTLREVIANMTQSNGNTCTGDALRTAHDVIFTPQNGARPEVIHDTLLVSDGHSNCGELTVQEGGQLLNTVSNVFALGVGLANDTQARMEVNSVVSNKDPRHIFSIERFQDFKDMVQSIRDRLDGQQACLPIVEEDSSLLI